MKGWNKNKDVDDGGKDKKKKKKEKPPMSSAGEVLSFVEGRNNKIIFAFGCLGGVGNGLVYPVLAYLFSTSFSSLGGPDNGLNDIRDIAYQFMVVGAFAFCVATVQTGCFEVVAARATRNFRTQWFAALLRQDAAYYDVYDVAGTASSIGPNSNKMRRGLGRKFGEGIQFFTTFLGGIIFSFYSSWKVALVVIAALPAVSISALSVVQLNQTQSSRASQAYSKAGSVAYSTVSAIKTVLSLNAVTEMIRQYSEATLAAYKAAVKPLWRVGVANGSMLGSFILLYCILTLFGSFLLYREVEDTGCDPSDSVDGNKTCDESGPNVFGAMLGVAFAAQGMSQFANSIETFTAARVACYPAMTAINRKRGAERQEIMASTTTGADGKDGSDKDTDEGDEEEGGVKTKAILPEYEIDASSPDGLKPEDTRGEISFKHVAFSYPTRPNNLIFKDFNLDIEAGKTVALVGPSGGGKSTTVSLIERFYDPTSGTVTLDGVDLKDINVKHLRSQVGYVGQEPTLFATTIARNIQYGCPGATQEQIEEAAKMANAHDFIQSFPDGYDTQVGDKGAQLSGGQKQRIAIARVLVANPKILLLDEATSALDSESELVVQEALDKLLTGEYKRTTIVIAHRLSTIHNADVIAVISDGTVVERGNHEQLMEMPTGHYRALVEKQFQNPQSGDPPSRNNSRSDLSKAESNASLSDSEHNTRGPVPSAQLSFRDVTFSYPTRAEKLVFDGFNLSVRQGETVALVGPSGGGKSTTVSLIERFYDPNEGIVEYEGVNLKDLNLSWLRDQIGYVGQEPTLFNTTIAKNIAYGFPEATEQDIVQAAKMANAHDFITSFPDGYDTEVGERGAQLSGGQKQRVAIARALVKRPKILLLDEATSALDSESEAVVQEALDSLMASTQHTTIVIAHRLSTIRNADRIAFIAGGRVKEIGTHDELMEKPRGRYKRLVETQQRGSQAAMKSLKEEQLNKKAIEEEEDEDEEKKKEKEAEDEEASKAFSAARARQMAKPDINYLSFGSIGAIMAGGVFPSWGVVFGLMIQLLFRRVYPCPLQNGDPPFGFNTCDDYYDSEADNMRERSFELAGYWVAIAAGCLFGNLMTFWGFGMASERMNRRIRDSAFASLVRQEVAFFDKRSVGAITSQLQDDAARIHTFSGEPIRTLLISLSSVVTGVIVSMIFMWPFALLSLGTIPFMGFATSLEMKTLLGADVGDDANDGLNSPGGIVVETLLNIRTVSALTLEKERYDDYVTALRSDDPHYVRDGFKSGATSGISMLIQQWVNALQFWWGGWLLYNYPNSFSFQDFLIAMFSLLFSLFGLGAAAQGASDRKECEKSAGRIFYLIDRESAIDPLSEDGKKLDEFAS